MQRILILFSLLFAASGHAVTNPTGHPIGGGEDYDDWIDIPDNVVLTKMQLRDALSAAAAGDVVYVDDDAEIDLTGEWDIVIPPGVVLASGRGRGGSLGARLYTRSKEKRILFRVGGAGVRITGLRIQGPSTTVDGPDCGGTDATGIWVYDETEADWGTRIDNNELWAWPAAAVSTSVIAGTRVHHNHIHHNRRRETTSGCRRYGLGYGVVTNLGNALIEANLFDHNRHDIASTGRPGSSYEARYNLSVQGLIGHSFDMHGCRDRPTDAACVDHPNTAGTRIDIHHNTFLDADHHAVVIRGIPEDGAYIANNEFIHRNRRAAIFQRYATGKMFVENNTFRANPGSGWFISFSGKSFWRFRAFSSYSPDKLAVGDFNNDGHQDVFRSSRGSWYVSSTARKAWEKWNTSDYKINKLRFGDFDGDGSTDVFRSSGGKWYVSWSGSGRWEQINSSSYAISKLRFGDFDGNGTTDVFRSNDGKWFVSWGGKSRWERINTSSYGIAKLRFADLNGDGATDVFRSTSSRWYVSWGGQGRWQQINRSSAAINRLKFCDFDADGADDVFFANGTDWRVSWSGTSRWERINKSSITNLALGDFNGDGRCDVLSKQGF